MFKYLNCKAKAISEGEFNKQKMWVLTLDPSKYKGQFTQMEVWLSKKDFSPKRLYTVDPAGNGSWYNIVNLSVVKSWKAEDFKYKPIKGVDEIDMREFMNRLFEKYVNALTLVLGISVGGTFAAETLFSNGALNVSETGKTGTLWVFSRGDLYSGVTLLDLKVGTNGVQVVESHQEQMSDSMTATQDGVFRDVLAEHRRTSSVYAGKLGYVLPMFGLNDDGEYLMPTGFFSVRGIDNMNETPLDDVPDALLDLDTAMYYAVSGFAYDSSKKQLWMARGAAGLGLYDVSGNSPKKGLYQLNLKTSALDTAKSSYKWEDKKNPRIFDVKQHPETGDIWMATSKGLWKRSADGKVTKASAALDTSARVTGLWMGGDPLTIIAETSRMEKESMKGALWVFREGDKDFAKAVFLDTAGKKQKKDIYDEGDYTVSDVAFVGNTAFVAVAVSGGDVSGYFKCFMVMRQAPLTAISALPRFVRSRWLRM